MYFIFDNFCFGVQTIVHVPFWKHEAACMKKASHFPGSYISKVEKEHLAMEY